MAVVLHQLRTLRLAVLHVGVPGPGRLAETAIQARRNAPHLRVEGRVRIQLAGPVLVQLHGEAEEVVEEGNPLFEPRIEDRILERELNHIVDTAKAQENEESFLQSAGIWAYYILGQALIHVERFVLTAAPLLISYNQKVSTIK